MQTPNKPVNFKTTRQVLDDWFSSIYVDPKVAEDPNRPGVTPQDMTEGKHQTDETDQGTGNKEHQGELGKDMAQEVASSTAPGTSVENAPENSGDSAANGIKDKPAVSVSESPADDISKMDNVPPEVKEAAAQYAHFYRLGNAVVDMIDKYFDENAAKNASDLAAKEAADVQAVQKRAAEMKAAHIDYLCQQSGCTPKEANDFLNKLAEENPAAILPPEALSDEEIQTTLADAAAADAAAAGEGAAPLADGGAPAPEGGAAPEDEIDQVIGELQAQGFSDDEIANALEAAIAETEGGAPVEQAPAEEPKVAEDPTPAPAVEPAPAGAPEGEAPVDGGAQPAEAAPAEGDMEAVQAELEQVAEQLQQEGYSQEEIADAIMQEMGITPDDVVDIVVENMKEQGGLSDEQARELLQSLGELEQQGVTPEQFAQALEQQQ